MIHGVLTEEEQRGCERLPVPLCVFSVCKNDCALLAVSDGLCRAFQTEREEFSVPGRAILERLIHPDDFEKLRSDLDAAWLSPDGRYAAVYRIRSREDRPYRWISCKGSILPREGGECLLYVFLSDVHDETELRREELSDRLRKDVLLSDILSMTKTAIFWKNADRRFLGANKAFLDYYGFQSEDEILGKNDEEMGWHTEPDPYKNDEIRVLRDGVSTYRIPGRCIARGENRNIVASKSPLIVDGKIVGLVGSFEDVTRETEQQQEIERLNGELREQLSDRDLLMSISEVCIIKISLRDYTLLEYNDAMWRMIGCTREEYESQYRSSMEAYFSGEFRADLDTLKNEAARALEAGERRFALNMRVPTAGGFVWVGGTASFADYDPDTGRPGALYAVYRDITDIIEAQKKLELAALEMQKSAMLETQISKMRRMIDGVPAGIGALRILDGVPDPQVQLNQYFIQRLNITTTQGNMADLAAFLGTVHPDDRQRFREEFEEFLRVKTLTTRQYRFLTVVGGYAWISVRGTVVRLSEQVEIAYFTYTNINDIKVAEAELRESRRFYREVVRAAKLSTCEYDIQNHTILMSEDSHTRSTTSILGLDNVIRNVPDSLAELIAPED